jgi:hypothetical protein
VVQMRDLHVEHNLLTSFAGLGDQPHLKHIFLQGNEASDTHRREYRGNRSTAD